MGGKPKAKGQARVEETRAFKKRMREVDAGIKEVSRKLDAIPDHSNWCWVSLHNGVLFSRVVLWSGKVPLTQNAEGQWGAWQGQNTAVARFEPQQWLAIFGRALVDEKPVKMRLDVTFLGGLY